MGEQGAEKRSGYVCRGEGDLAVGKTDLETTTTTVF